MFKVAVFIPSYKRPLVLKKTLEGLFGWSLTEMLLPPLEYKVGIYVALNECSDQDKEVVESFKFTAKKANISYNYLCYPENKGKAEALNDLFEKFSLGYDYLITLDNDMVIKNSWLHLALAASRTNLELVGFGSSTFWAHQPRRELVEDKSYLFMEDYRIYNIDQIAGGMLFFPRNTLEYHKWTNKGGVYGFDDAQMCLDVKDKGVLFWGVDWLDHDPLSCSTPELRHYHDRKQHFFSQGQYILQKGWDT